MTRDGQHRAQRAATRAATGARARLGRSLTDAETTALRAVAGNIEAWSRVARRLVDDGVRQAEIGRSTGTPAATVSQRLRRRR